MTSHNEHTGDLQQSKPLSKQGRENWDNIFDKDAEAQRAKARAEKRAAEKAINNSDTKFVLSCEHNGETYVIGFLLPIIPGNYTDLRYLDDAAFKRRCVLTGYALYHTICPPVDIEETDPTGVAHEYDKPKT